MPTCSLSSFMVILRLEAPSVGGQVAASGTDWFISSESAPPPGMDVARCLNAPSPLLAYSPHGRERFDEAVIVPFPHNLLIACNLEGVRAFALLVAQEIADQQVAVLERLDAGNPR